MLSIGRTRYNAVDLTFCDAINIILKINEIAFPGSKGKGNKGNT